MSDLLRVDGLTAGYGEAVVLSNLSFAVAQGEALALLGRNGAGKTTLLNTIVGLTRRRAGTITLAGRDLSTLRPDQRANGGVGWVPQERNIFRSLTVEENLTAVARPGKFDVSRIYEMFPRLAERRDNMGNQLSGGEQQMLAVGRALVLNPQILLLDEPLEGLAPIIVDELLAALRRIIETEKMSVILVEQSARKILPLTDRAIILERGAIAWSGDSSALLEDREALATLLAVAEKK
ncbi:MAG: ABC transporter ATP-binding protein [Hyphomicrobiales bacterium]|nr:ABC transporter ATP-binding protein [Hyphomicrobiales bacterium]